MKLLEGIRVLLIDDNDIDIAVNVKLLRLADITTDIRSFNQPKKFFDYLDSEQSLDDSLYQVVLMDIMMPGMNGFECLEKFDHISDIRKQKFIIYMLSSSIDRNDIRRAEENRYVQRVLEKPLDIYLLRKLIEAKVTPPQKR